MKPTLLYITHGFPVSDEVFTRDEFPFLKKKEWDIIILPRLGDASRLPERAWCGAGVDYSLLGHKAQKSVQLLRPTAWKMIAREYADHAAHNQALVPQTLLRAVGIALQAEKTIYKLLMSRKASHTPLVAYSFWFSEVVIGIARLRKHFPQLRVVTRINGADIFVEQLPRNYLPLRYQRMLAPDVVTAVSRAGMEQLRQEGYPEKNISLYPLGVPAPLGRSLPSAPGHLVLASCAYAAPLKRLRVFIDSLYTFSLTQPNIMIHWHYIGDGECYDSLKRQAEQLLAPRPNVTYTFHGRLDVDDVRRFFAQERIDAVVSVSSSEGGVPVSLQEAAACGIPLLATDAGGTRDIVTPETGILLPLDYDEKEFCAAMTTIMDWKDTKDRQGIAEYCSKHFSLEVNYSAFVDKILEPQMNISRQLLE